MSDKVLAALAETIKARRTAESGSSYTKQLLDAGSARCARKFGEEAIELVVASVEGDRAAVTAEAADVLYHLLVLLEASDIGLAEVGAVLSGRMTTSGLAEKASRKPLP